MQKNTLYNVIKTLSSILYPLITFPYISRVLGAEKVGTVNFGANFVSYFSLITTIGVTAYAVRECSKVKGDKKELGKVASQIYSINICIAAIAYLLLAACLIWVSKLKGYEILILIQSSTIVLTVIGTDWLNTAMEDFHYITIRTMIFQLIALICMFLFVHSPQQYMAYAVTSIIASSGAYIVNIFYRRKYCRVRFTFHMEWKHHFPPLVTMLLMILSQHILGNLDITMLGFWNGDFVVGLYTTAVYLTNFVTQIVTSIIWVLMPELTKRFQTKDFTQINHLLRYAVSFTLVLGLPCFVGLFMMPEEIIGLVGGAEYMKAAGCVRILALAMLVAFIHNITGNLILLPANREKQFMYACTAGMLLNAVTNYLLIPVWGIEGAAMTTLFANIVIAAVTLWRIPKEIKISNKKCIVTGPVLGSLAVILICIAGKILVANQILRLAAVMGVSGICYFGILFLVKDEFAMTTIWPVVKKIWLKK